MEKNRIEKIEKQISKIKGFLIILIGLMDILLSPLSVHPTYRFIIYILLLVVTGTAVPLMRMIETHSYKVSAYIYIGFASYWVVGNAFNDPCLMFEEFLPILVLGIANAIAVLIAIVDGSKKGYIYGSMGFVVILYNLLASGDISHVGGRPDILVLVMALWSLIPMMWCHSFSRVASRLKFSAKRSFYSTFKGVLYTLPLYLLLSIIVVSSHQPGSGEVAIETIKDLLSAEPSAIIVGIAPISWFYFLAHATATMLAFFSNELVLHAYEVEKEIAEDGERIYHLNITSEAPKEHDDPYKKIIKEMRSFKKDFSSCKLDRLVTTQEIGKIKNEMEIMTSKYEHESSEIAEKLLKEIEKDVEFAFRQ